MSEFEHAIGLARSALRLIEQAQETKSGRRITKAIDATIAAYREFALSDDSRYLLQSQLAELHVLKHEIAHDKQDLISAESALFRAVSESSLEASPKTHEVMLIAYWTFQREQAHAMPNSVRRRPATNHTLLAISEGKVQGEDTEGLLETAYQALSAYSDSRQDDEDFKCSLDIIRRMIAIVGYNVNAWLWIGRLSLTLQLQSEATGNTALLEEALRHSRFLTSTIDPSHEHFGGILTGQAAIIGLRSKLTNSLEDLSTAIDLARAATPYCHGPILEMHNQVLATVLLARYEQLGSTGDLNEAKQIAARADLMIGSDDAQLALINLVGIQFKDALESGNAAAVDDIVALSRRYAVTAENLHAGVRIRANINHSLTLSELAQAKLLSANSDRARRRARRSHKKALLNEAIVYAKRAFFESLTGSPEQWDSLKALTLSLETRFDYLGSTGDLSEAIAALDGFAALQPDVWNEANRLTDIGIVARKMHDARCNAQASEARARSALQYVAFHPSSPSSMAVLAATELARLEARVDYTSSASARAHTRAVALLPELVWAGGVEEDLLRRIGSWPTITSNAAASCLATGWVEQAIKVLEQGRGTVWSTIVGTGRNWAELDSLDLELATELRAMQARFKDIYSTRGRASVIPTDQRVALSQSWRSAITRLQSVAPNFALDDFEIAELQAWLDPEELIVVINCSSLRSDALCISDRAISIVSLPKISTASVARQLSKFHGSYAPWVSPSKRDKRVSAVLDWLWRTIAAPLMANDECGFAAAQQVTWCPTGLLGLLPIHAADDRASGSNLQDLKTSSYIPTLAALKRSRIRAAKNQHDSSARYSFLIVAVAESSSSSSNRLEFVEAEVGALEAVLPDSEILTGPSATAEAVLSRIANVDSIHFSCHGVVDTDEPFNSGLEMFDARLTIGNLSGSGAAGRLAFLSACESAVGSVQNADELVSLASALQFAGWQEVIATFAPVRDDIAAETARIFYERLKDSVDSGRLPEARSLIAHATRQIRSRWPDRPSHWAPFAHFGSS